MGGAYNPHRTAGSTRLIPEARRFRQHFSGIARSTFTMMKNIALSRPAMSAIAAFLVLSPPSAFAQEAPTVTMTPPVAAPTPQTPPTVPEPNTTTPIAAPQTTQPAAPKPFIRLPMDVAPAEVAAPKAAEPAVTSASPRTERATARNQLHAAKPASATIPVDAGTETAPAEEIAPVAVPVTMPIEPITEATPLPAEKMTASGSEFPWEIAGGAAALLIVGGAGIAFVRRRRNQRELADESWEVADASKPVTAARTTEPVTADAPQWVTPAYAPPERTTPVFAAAPSGSMGRHEAMAIAGPTADNPFATLSKRLKRARFLDRQERIAYDETLAGQKDMIRKPVSAWEISQRPAAATREQEVRRPEAGRGRPGLRPGFARN